MRPTLTRIRAIAMLAVSFVSVVLLGAALSGPAQAASSPAAVVSAPSNSYECHDYNYRHGNYHYYKYCYDYRYKSDSDRSHNKRWYESFWLYYWYYDHDRHMKYESCHFDHNFGYHHPNGPYQKYCSGH